MTTSTTPTEARYNITQAAAYLGYTGPNCQHQVRQLMQKGKLHPVKEYIPGTSIQRNVFTKADLDAYLATKGQRTSGSATHPGTHKYAVHLTPEQEARFRELFPEVELEKTWKYDAAKHKEYNQRRRAQQKQARLAPTPAPTPEEAATLTNSADDARARNKAARGH